MSPIKIDKKLPTPIIGNEKTKKGKTLTDLVRDFETLIASKKQISRYKLIKYKVKKRLKEKSIIVRVKKKNISKRGNNEIKY